jgi:hypothetical protein
MSTPQPSNRYGAHRIASPVALVNGGHKQNPARESPHPAAIGRSLARKSQCLCAINAQAFTPLVQLTNEGRAQAFIGGKATPWWALLLHPLTLPLPTNDAIVKWLSPSSAGCISCVMCWLVSAIAAAMQYSGACLGVTGKLAPAVKALGSGTPVIIDYPRGRGSKLECPPLVSRSGVARKPKPKGMQQFLQRIRSGPRSLNSPADGTYVQHRHLEHKGLFKETCSVRLAVAGEPQTCDANRKKQHSPHSA